MHALLLAALLAAPSPDKLSNARFYEEAVAEQIKKGTLDLAQYTSGTPWMLTFTKPGRLTLEWGQEDESCSFTVSPGGTAPGVAWTLDLACPRGKRTATLAWLDDKRLRTDLFGEKSITLVRHDVPFARVVSELEEKFSAKELPRFVGKWTSDAGDLTIDKRGTTLLDGTRYATRVVRCKLESAAADGPEGGGLCVEITGPEDKHAVLHVGDKAESLTEGRFSDELADGRWFVQGTGARTFKRAAAKKR